LGPVPFSLQMLAETKADAVSTSLIFHCAAEYEFPLPEKGKFKITRLDPWEMTKRSAPGTFSGKSKIALSGKPNMSVLIEKV